MGAVVEQIQQTYDLLGEWILQPAAVGWEFLLHEGTVSWNGYEQNSLKHGKKNRKVLLYSSGKWSGNISRWNKNVDWYASKLLLDLKNGYNIGKLVRLDYDQKKKTVIWLRFHVRNTRSMEKLIRQLNCVWSFETGFHVKLKGYDGKSLFVHAGWWRNITYTNQSGDKYLRNYSLLKHLKGQQAITEEEADLFKKKFDNRESGVALW